MEEEGSVVYYEVSCSLPGRDQAVKCACAISQGSPGALWAHSEEDQEELVLKEDEGGGIPPGSSAAPQATLGPWPWHYLDIRRLGLANEVLIH